MRQSAFGIVSLILGILGLLSICILIGVIPCILAVVFAIIAIMNKNVGHGTAIGGLSCGLIGILIFIWIMLPKSEKEIQVITMEINKKETIEDIIEFTPIEGNWAAFVMPSNSEKIYDAAGEGEVPYIFMATLKNIGSKEISLSKAINAKFIFNDQYEFNATIRVESANGDSFEFWLKPLQERKCYIYASIPDEIYESFEQCKVNMTFTEAIDGRAEDIEDSEIVYSIIFYDKH